MLLLVGSKESKIKSGELTNACCTNCKTISSLYFSIYTKYAFITFIPIFPVEKRVYLFCENCEENICFGELKENDNIRIEQIKQSTKHPIWTFIGTIVLIITTVVFFKNYYESKDNTIKYIKNNEIGDVFHIKQNDGYYTSMKIDSIKNEKVYFTNNDYNAYLPYEIDEIDKVENYTKSKSIMTKREILKHYNDGFIISINRKK